MPYINSHQVKQMPKGRKQGFSLIEMLVGLAILTVSMLAVGTMLMRASENSKWSNSVRIGDGLTLEIIESMRTQFTYSIFFPLDSPNSVKSSFQLQKFMPASTTKFFYQDNSANPTDGTLNTGVYSAPFNAFYLENTGKGMAAGQQFLYKWHVEDQKGLNYPPGLIKLDVTVGWDSCTGTDPASCRRKSKVTSFLIQASN
jgi:prepilin-type N-terminal cleavage/methylation domain-containing protein